MPLDEPVTSATLPFVAGVLPPGWAVALPAANAADVNAKLVRTVRLGISIFPVIVPSLVFEEQCSVGTLHIGGARCALAKSYAKLA
ncbi:MAG TPA: hypothetical protein VF226_03970 [Hyphomicrobiaceae bacterium]|jgi:hypothetical protein